MPGSVFNKVAVLRRKISRNLQEHLSYKTRPVAVDSTFSVDFYLLRP